MQNKLECCEGAVSCHSPACQRLPVRSSALGCLVGESMSEMTTKCCITTVKCNLEMYKQHPSVGCILRVDFQHQYFYATSDRHKLQINLCASNLHLNPRMVLLAPSSSSSLLARHGHGMTVAKKAASDIFSSLLAFGLTMSTGPSTSPNG